MRFGFHVSIAGGWQQALLRAVARRCATLQVFSSSPVQWARAPLDPAAAAWFGAALHELDIQPLFVHAIYLLNLATGDEGLWRRSRDHLAEELGRAAQLGAAGVVVHLGGVGDGGSAEAGLERVARAVDSALERAEGGVRVLLENCAGGGNLVGATPQELAAVMGASRRPERLAVCLDLAHAFEAGFAVHESAGFSAFLADCGRAFGLERLELIHANDSKTPLGSRADRHWHIGKGQIGRAGFQVILNEPRLVDSPFIMETPSSEEWDARNLRALRAAVRPEARPPLPAPPTRQPAKVHIVH